MPLSSWFVVVSGACVKTLSCKTISSKHPCALVILVCGRFRGLYGKLLRKTVLSKHPCARTSHTYSHDWHTRHGMGSERCMRRCIARLFASMQRVISERCVLCVSNIRYCWQGNHRYTVVYGVYIRFWPTLVISERCV